VILYGDFMDTNRSRQGKELPPVHPGSKESSHAKRQKTVVKINSLMVVGLLVPMATLFLLREAINGAPAVEIATAAIIVVFTLILGVWAWSWAQRR
jgi:hypothetical protein